MSNFFSQYANYAAKRRLYRDAARSEREQDQREAYVQKWQNTRHKYDLGQISEAAVIAKMLTEIKKVAYKDDDLAGLMILLKEVGLHDLLPVEWQWDDTRVASKSTGEQTDLLRTFGDKHADEPVQLSTGAWATIIAWFTGTLGYGLYGDALEHTHTVIQGWHLVTVYDDPTSALIATICLFTAFGAAISFGVLLYRSPQSLGIATRTVQTGQFEGWRDIPALYAQYQTAQQTNTSRNADPRLIQATSRTRPQIVAHDGPRMGKKVYSL